MNVFIYRRTVGDLSNIPINVVDGISNRICIKNNIVSKFGETKIILYRNIFLLYFNLQQSFNCWSNRIKKQFSRLEYIGQNGKCQWDQVGSQRGSKS